MENLSGFAKGHWKIASFQLPNELKLRYGIYCQDEASVERYVVFLSGHGEYIEKYDYLPEDLGLPKNVGFLTWDHRGQGASDGEPRLHIEDYENLAKDAQILLNKIVGKKPYTIIAHSMGGLIAVYSTMKGYLKPETLVLSAPLFGIQHAIPQVFGRFVGALGVRLGLGQVYFQKHLQARMTFENNMFTHSRQRFDRRSQNPYKTEGVTFGWIKSTFEAIRYVSSDESLARFQTPTKILYGDDERLVATSAIKAWVEKAKKNNSKAQISAEELAETRHEIFAEAPSAYSRVLELTRAGLFHNGMASQTLPQKAKAQG